MPREFRRNWFSVVAMLVAGGATAAATLAPNPPPQAPPTPMQLFSRMLPAIRHPRCNNCHGVVDPKTGNNHGGGLITTEDCMSCHDEAHEWQIPGPEHFFEGRTDRQICGQIADFVTTAGHQNFIDNHAKTDDQIIHAFRGYAAGARDTTTTPADRPLINHPQFIQAATDWINLGNGACDPEGTITVEEGVNSVEVVRRGPGTTIRLSQTGNRKVVITSVAGGKWRADIQVDGETINQATVNSTNAAGQPCTTIQTIRGQYSGQTSGPALVVVKDTMFRLGIRPPKGDYRIDVTLPAEKTTRTETTKYLDGCGVGLKDPPPDVQQFDWSSDNPAPIGQMAGKMGWEFTIEGNLDDVKQRNAVGGCAKTILWTEVGQSQNATYCNRWANMGNAVEPWLVNHGGAYNSFQNGKPIPFQIVWTWNLRRR